LPESIRPLAVAPPLRILVAISSPDDYAGLDVDREWANLREALGELEQQRLVEMELLKKVSAVTLQRQLRRQAYHILHYIGHGGFDQHTQDGVLVFEDAQARGTFISGQDLGTLLHDHDSMRLAVLNACEGARNSRSDPFGGTAQSLLQQG